MPTPLPAPRAYGYDPAGRLASSSLPTAPTALTQSWTYDNTDRLTQIAHPGQASTTLGYDAADELTSAGGTTYGYDPRGNRIQAVDPHGNTTTYGYDQANRLTSYTGPAVGAAVQNSGGTASGTTQASYAYQADGLRNDVAWDRAEGMRLILSSLIAVPGGLQEYVTGPGGMVVEIDLLPVASTSGSVQGVGFTTTQTVYVHSDAMGSTRVLTNANGTPLVGYTYDPYGQATLTSLSSATTSIVNPILFQGQYVDPLSGLMYLRNRWYDPTTAQFLTRDPLVTLTHSAYGYAGADPVNGSDPSGLCPIVCPHWAKTVANWTGFGSFFQILSDFGNKRAPSSDTLHHTALNLLLLDVGKLALRAGGIAAEISTAASGISVAGTALEYYCDRLDQGARILQEHHDRLLALGSHASARPF